MTDSFPFGSPLAPRAPSATDPRRIFVLAPYPSALHVEWTPPSPFRPVAALAVDNEPVPFWTARDEEEQVEAWKQRVGWKAEWGTAAPAGPLNGSSGLWLDQKVLSPLKATRAETWMTYCLPTYRFSHGQEEVVTSRFLPFAEKQKLPWTGVPESLRNLEEDALVGLGRPEQKRLLTEFKISVPRLVVTLGNVALRVFAQLANVPEPELLKPNKDYGTETTVLIGGKSVTWLPLSHPGQRSKEWQAAHTKWMRAKTRPATA